MSTVVRIFLVYTDTLVHGCSGHINNTVNVDERKTLGRTYTPVGGKWLEDDD